MKKIAAFSVFIFSMLVGAAQQQSLISHQEYIGYYNPALIRGGDVGHISFLYRSQWEGLGPTSSTLFAALPFRNFRSYFFRPEAIATIVQYEDFAIFNRTNVEFMLASSLAEFNDYSLHFGANLGLSHIGVNMMEFDLEELVDPELLNLDRKTVPTSRLGLSLRGALFDWGVSARFTDFNAIQEYNTTLTSSFGLRRTDKYRFQPMLLYRSDQEFSNSQLEAQLRMTYDNRFSFTAGYRQKFGILFQLGFRFNKVKASYGSEIPSTNKNSLGLTHEVLMAYNFETPASIRHKKDSVFKAKRDSLNRQRIDSLRKRQRTGDFEERDEDRLDIVGVPSVDTEDPERSDVVEYSDREDILTFEELTTEAEDETHVVLNHIGFEKGLYLLKPSAYKELDKLVVYLKQHKSLHFEIQGHTDDSGSADSNYTLSDLRAQTVYNYLISEGINPVRMNVIGYGEDLPIYPNDTPEHRRLNRRIEIVFLKSED